MKTCHGYIGLGLTCTVYISDFGHPCYDQFTPVNTNYQLTSIT